MKMHFEEYFANKLQQFWKKEIEWFIYNAVYKSTLNNKYHSFRIKKKKETYRKL